MNSSNETREYFAKLFYSNPLPMSISEVGNSKIIDVNHAFEKLSGHSRDYLIGKTGIDLGMRWTQEQRMEIVERLKKEKSVRNFLITGYNAEQEELSLSLSLEFIRHNNRDCVISSVLDISDMKKSEETLKRFNEQLEEKISERTFRLQQQEHLLRLFIENSPAALTIFDHEMNYIIASKRYLADYRLGKIDLAGKNHYEIFPEMPERWKEIHKRCLAGAIEKNGEDKFLRADGNMDWVRWEIHPWYKNPGEIGGIILLSEVITAQKKAEEDLQKSEQKFRSLIEQAVDGIMVIDDTGKIILTNPALAETLGYSQDEMLSMNIGDTYPKGEAARAVQRLATVKEKGRMRFERAMLKKDGKLFPVELNIQKTKEGYYQAIIRDISDRKKAEEEITKKTKLLRELTQHLERVREEERKRISREIHDELGQQLAAIKIDASWLSKRVSDESVQRKTLELNKLIDETVKTVRRISADLRPDILDDLGLAAALEWKIKKFVQRTGIPCTFRNEAGEFNLSPVVSINIYRMIQESLTNITRHSGARSKSLTT